MKTEGTNLLLLTISAFWSSSNELRKEICDIFLPKDKEGIHHCCKYTEG